MRVARVVDELRRRLTVCVVAPVEGPPPDGITVERLPPARPVSRRAALGTPPRLGRRLLGPERGVVLEHVLVRHRPRAVLYTNSYLAAAAPPVPAATVVDFPDVEARRMASLTRSGHARSRAAHGLEAVKARWWEPRVARRSTFVSAASADDVRVLSSWGADAMHVPHGADRFELSPSDPRGPVTFVASFGYAPNRHGLEWLLGKVWPRLRGLDPALRLRLVGRRAEDVVSGCDVGESIEVVSDAERVDRYYEEASVVLAPVRVGGGTQLKVTEALSRGRVVVATGFSSRSAPRAMAGGVLVADDAETFAAAVLHLWRNLAARRACEKAIAGALPLPTWEETCAPLVDGLEGLVRAAGAPRGRRSS